MPWSERLLWGSSWPGMAQGKGVRREAESEMNSEAKPRPRNPLRFSVNR